MRMRTLVSAGLVLALVVAGIWMLGLRVAPAPETAYSQQLRPGAAAPGGVGGGSQPAQAVAGTDVILHAPVVPAVVNLADVAPGVRDRNSQLDRWQRGEIDLEERDGIISRLELAERKQQALSLPASSTIQVAVEGPSPSAPSQGVGFDSLDYTECCGGGGNVPPDPELAVGPNHAIAVVNVAFEIYSKTGTVLRPATTFASFFGSSCPSGVFDPNVLYDESADRYILGIDQRNQSTRDSNYCVAVSATGDPLGSWYLYRFDTNLSSNRNWMDYPHAGVGIDAIYMGGNMFSWQGSFAEARVWAFNKSQMYAGQSTQAAERGLNVAYDTPQPLDLKGWNQGTWPSSGDHTFIVNKDYNGKTYSVLRWPNPFGGGAVSEVGTFDLDVATGVVSGFPVDSPQSGGGTIDAGDVRPLDFEYRNGYAWTSMTVSCNPGSGTVNCARWAQIDPTTAQVVQAGVLASDGEYRSYPDLAVNTCGDMAIGYTRTSTSMFPSVYVTGRQSSTAPGQLEPETLVKAGEINYTSFESSSPRRWGDYTGMTVAPDGVTFWYLGEYSKDTGTTNGRWGNWIASFTYANCQGGGTPTPPAAPTSLGATAVSSSQINLSWTDNASDEQGFRIERCQGAGCTSFVEIAQVGANVTSFQNTGLAASTSYSYRVLAFNAGGSSDYSNTASATTQAASTPPAAPSNLTATAASNSQINLAWTDNASNEDGFAIERCTGNSCTNFAQIATVGPNTTTFQNTGLAARTLYRYRVRAFNASGNSAYSNTAQARTPR